MSNARITSEKARTGKVIVGTIRPGTDIITGILKICEENNLKFGNIVTMIGNLSKAHFVCVTPDDSNKMGFKVSEPIEIKGPLEFVCGQGIIGISDSKEREIHLHCVLCDKNAKLYGGHFNKGGNPVLTTMEVVIQELKEVKLIRALDQETGFPGFKPYGKVQSLK